MSQKYGIIDIGSNSIRLVIYERKRGADYKEIENVKIVAKLRKYMDKDGYVSNEGINVLVDTLLHFQEITRFHQLDNIICAATATIRQAKNHQKICKIVKNKTDFTIQIISEYEEAYYGYLAVVNSTPFEDGITIDIGGGSTEVTYIKNRKLIYYHSFPFGVLSLQQQFVKGDVPTEDEKKMIAQYVQSQFLTLSWLQNCKLPIIAIGGSARNMVRVHRIMTTYPISGEHLYEMKNNDMDVVQEFLISLPYEELQKLDGVSRDRADTIILAIQVFIELSSIVNMTSFFLSRKGIRDGLLYKYFVSSKDTAYIDDVREESIRKIVFEYHLDEPSNDEKYAEALNVCQQLKKIEAVTFTYKDYILLRHGMALYNMGKYIDLEASAQHTFYLLANKTINGFLHKERVALALLASYQSKGNFKEYMFQFQEWFTKKEKQKLQILGSVIKLVSCLYTTARSIVRDITITEEENNLLFTIICKNSYLIEEAEAKKQKKHLERALKKNIQLHFILDEHIKEI